MPPELTGTAGTVHVEGQVQEVCKSLFLPLFILLQSQGWAGAPLLYSLICSLYVWPEDRGLSSDCGGLDCAALRREVGPETAGREIWGAPRLEAEMGHGPH